jgi:hypothetical protein
MSISARSLLSLLLLAGFYLPLRAMDHDGQDSLAAARERLKLYPKKWERMIPKGTHLDSLRRSLEKEYHLLPALDLEDRSPLPVWFRIYLRKRHHNLPRSGPYQYPRTANRILQWMLDHPDSTAR